MPLTLPADIAQPCAEERRNASTTFASFSSRIFRALTRETTSGRFIPQMDGLRFVALSMVVLFHLNAYLMAKARFYGGEAVHPDWLCRGALSGSHGVELFFVISGFILALPFAAHQLAGAPAVSLRRYYLRRLTRLEAPYIITLLLFTALAYWTHPALAPLKSHVAASLFYLHNCIYGAPSTALGVAWSLEIEVQFYILVPLLTLLFAIRNSFLRRACILLLVFSGMAEQAKVREISPQLALSVVAYLQFFLIGFLLADIFLLQWKKSPRLPILWDLISLAGWPAMFICLQTETRIRWLFPALVFLLYCAAFRGRWTSRIFSVRWITAIGGMCYSIYLIHYEVISAVARFSKTIGERLPDPVFLLVQFVIVGIAIVLVCAAYFLLLEKPCMNRDWPQRLWQRAKLLGPTGKGKPQAAFAD
ncbi:MAG: acyltransferase [Candidatus Sulfotelmatobacter sp.]